MKVPSDVKKCVVFIGLKLADGDMKIVGTGIFIYDDISINKQQYIATAKHVLEGINNKGLEEIWIRVNLKNGSSTWMATNFTKWKLNSDRNTDVGVYQIGIDNSWDHLNYRLSTYLSNEVIDKNEVDIGDEVFVIGLFVHHSGQNRNIPIARIGNIAAMKEEKIQTSQHLMEGYLIEARSIGGLSGSPVFINLGVVRFINGSLQHSDTGKAFYLMGLIYGHFDVKSSLIDDVEIDATSERIIDRVNTGIAIVTPVEKLIETILQ